jgi:dTDP-4-amino-4,6-dideoxygalactose transaminase
VQIPFLDLITPHRELEEELVSVFRDCLRNASFVGGPQVQAFEEEFAQFCETKYCVAVNSGTDALRFALIAAGIGPGDEVITVPYTFIATTEAVSQTGANVAFVDIDEKTYNMDPNQLEHYLRKRCKVRGSRSEATHINFHCATGNKRNRLKPPTSGLTQQPNVSSLQPPTSRLTPLPDVSSLRPPTSSLKPRPRAVLPVHLYGQPADMDSIQEIADQYGLMVIEDSCQAHGALYYSRKDKRWKKAGSMGLAAAFSFYPGKNLGACGEGGAVTTNNEEIAQKIRMLRDHGQARKYYHEFEGYNGRLDAIQCGILRIKLKYLSDWNEKRRNNASLYNEYFAQSSSITRESQVASGKGFDSPPGALRFAPNASPIFTPFVPSWAKPVFHLYVIRSPKRDALQKYLLDNGIGTGLHYPIPLHLQKAYGNNGFEKGDFPVTERVSPEILSLPMFPNLTKDQIEYVAEKIITFHSST